MPRGIYERTTDIRRNPQSAETKAKISAALKDNPKVSVALRNRYKDPAERAKTSAALKGNPKVGATRIRPIGSIYFFHDYVVIKCHDKVWRLEHRVVMEEHLGRPLQDDEVVHHRDGIRCDNRIKNLQVMTDTEHNQLHRVMAVAS